HRHGLDAFTGGVHPLELLGSQRGDLHRVDALDLLYLVGDAAYFFQNVLAEDVALGGLHQDGHPVTGGEAVLVLAVHFHIGVVGRHHVVELGAYVQLEQAQGKAQGDHRDHHTNQVPVTDS